MRLFWFRGNNSLLLRIGPTGQSPSRSSGARGRATGLRAIHRAECAENSLLGPRRDARRFGPFTELTPQRTRTVPRSRISREEAPTRISNSPGSITQSCWVTS